MVQADAALTTVLEAVAELSGVCSSFVALEILAVLDMMVPFGRVVPTLKVNVNTAMELAGRVANVQLIVPVLPADGVVQEKAAPVSCVSDTKVVLSGTALVSVTFCASSGPVFLTSIL
jgi:hypothetical protein